MALFSDGPASTIDDLVQYDSYLLTVATTEGIDVSAKLQLASTELEIELAAIFGREASVYAPVLGEAPLDTNHLAVTPALKAWHTFKSLESVYRDAYFSQLNDRYQKKWKEFQGLASWSKGKFIDTGAGLVIDPLPQPGAPVSTFVTSTLAGGTLYFTITFINATGEESSPALLTQISIPDGNDIVIGAPAWPANGTGWNIYGATSPGDMTLQNTAPLALTGTWRYSFPGVTGGAPCGNGQTPNVTRDLPRRIMRG